MLKCSAFGEATRLKINMQKRTIAPIRCADTNLDAVLQNFPGPRVCFPVKYLGLPLTLGRLRMAHLQYIIDRAKGKVAGWQGRLVNVAGRRELVRSVLSSLPVYLMTVIKPPKNFLREPDKLRRRFLWAGDHELTGGKCKVGWFKVCTPTVNGGLGILELEKFSRALRLRWLWFSWEDTERPWKDMQMPVDKDDIALFNAATRVELGNGAKAAFWTSRWLQGDAPATIFLTLFNHSRRKNRSVAEALTNDKWIQDVDHNMTERTIAEFVALWRHLQNITLLPLQEDRITWLHTRDGQYTAKSAYDLQFVGTTKSLAARTLGERKCR